MTTDLMIAQQGVWNVPTFLADGNLGIATAFGVARITLGAYKLNVMPDADQPAIHPVVTIAVPEISLLQFAHEILERAEKLGISIPDEPTP